MLPPPPTANTIYLGIDISSQRVRRYQLMPDVGVHLPFGTSFRVVQESRHPLGFQLVFKQLRLGLPWKFKVQERCSIYDFLYPSNYVVPAGRAGVC